MTARRLCLQTLTEIALEKNSSIIFPLPLEFMKYFTQIIDRNENKA